MSRLFPSIFCSVLVASVFIGPARGEAPLCETPLWYNGDGDPRAFNSGMFGNAVSDHMDYASIIFEDFEVTDPEGWTITEVWSNNFTNARHVIAEAEWQIRREVVAGDVADGGGGELIAGARAAATQVIRLPSCLDDYSHGVELSVVVSGLNVHLPPGRYYVGVAPVLYALDQSLPTDTLGGDLNAVGTGEPDNAFVLRRNGDNTIFKDLPPHGEVFEHANWGSPDGAPNYAVGVAGFRGEIPPDAYACLADEERCEHDLDTCAEDLMESAGALQACITDLQACQTREADSASALGLCQDALATATEAGAASLAACEERLTTTTAQGEACAESLNDALIAGDRCQQQVDALQRERDDLVAQVATLETERAALEATQGALLAALEDSEARNDDLILRVDALEGTIAELDLSVTLLRLQIESLEAQALSLLADNEALAAQRDEAARLAAALDADNETLRESLAAVNAARIEAQAQVSALLEQARQAEVDREALARSLEKEQERTRALELALRKCEDQRAHDGDGDGVPDNADACPGTEPGAAVDSRGCSHAQHCARMPGPVECRITHWTHPHQRCTWNAFSRLGARCVPAR